MNGPLSGKRIVVTRSPEQAEEMAHKLESLGAEIICLPVIDFVPLPAPELDNALANLADYEWLVFTSGNAVRFFWERLGNGRPPAEILAQVRIAAVGSGTTRLLAENGVKVDFTPAEFTGEALALGLGEVAGQRVLLPRARVGRPEIVNLLRARGATVEEIALYDTVTADPDPQSLAELEKGIDVITFTSPSSVRNFLTVVGRNSNAAAANLRDTDCRNCGGGFSQIFPGVVIACIGPSTAAEVEKQGIPAAIMPDDYTIDGLVTAVSEHFMRER